MKKVDKTLKANGSFRKMTFKTGNTNTQVACAWAGAVIEWVTGAFGHGQLGQKANELQKAYERHKQLIHQWTNRWKGPHDQPMEH